MRSDFAALFVMGFVIVYDLTVCSSSILPYINSLADSEQRGDLVFSVTLSFSALAQLVSSVICGFLARKIGMKPVFLILQSTSICGTLLYAFSAWPIGSAWGVFFGKTLSGFNGGSMGLALSYMSTVVVDKQQRTQIIANFRANNIVAAIPSSAASLILAIPFLEFSIGSYPFNVYTYPAWSSLILQVISLSLNAKFLNRVEVTAVPTPDGAKKAAASTSTIYVSKGVVLVLSIFFFNGYLMGSLSYVLPIVMMEGYGWSVIQYAPVFFILSCVGLVAVLFTKFLSQRLKDMSYIIVVPGLGYISMMTVLCCIGAVGIGRLPRFVGEVLFLFGAETSFGAFQMVQTVLSSIFSQIIPMEFIIRMMPLTTTMFALGKITGPLICQLETEVMGLGMIFYVMLVVTAGLMFATIIFNKHLTTAPTNEEAIVIISDSKEPVSSMSSEDKEAV